MSVTVLGWLGILIGFGAVMLVMRRERGMYRAAMVLALAAGQTIVTLYYHNYSLTHSSDSTMYYFDPYNYFEQGFGFGTQFAIWIVQVMKDIFGGTYLDYFLLFQGTGTWGAVFLMRTHEELFASVRAKVPFVLLAWLFIPSLHFFTASIGKDGPLFLGAALAGWSLIDIRRRWLAFGFATALMMLFRPHIALIAFISLAFTLVFDKRTRFWVKATLCGLAFVGLAGAVATIESTFRLDMSNVETVSDFITAHSESGQYYEGGTTVSVASFPLRVLSLLFRPLFFDAEGMNGYIASVENLALLGLFIYLIINGRRLVALFRQVALIRYSVVFAALITIMLSLIYYNVGLGLRQKMMMMPAILTILAGVMASRRVQFASAPPRRVGPPAPIQAFDRNPAAAP